MVFTFDELDQMDDEEANTPREEPSVVPETLESSPPQLNRVRLPTHTSSGEPLADILKWWGGALGSDGCLYCAPYGANAVLRLSVPNSDAEGSAGVVCEVLSDPCVPGHKERFRNPVSVSTEVDGRNCELIVRVPSRAESVLQIEPVPEGTPRISCIGNDLGKKLSKWMGSVASPEGSRQYSRTGIVYGLPYAQRSVLRIDVTEQRIDLLGDFGPVMYKYWGGAVGSDSAVYCPPYAAARVLRIGPEGLEEMGSPFCDLVGADLSSQAKTDRKFKWMGGVASDDGCIFGVPYDADGVLRIDPRAEELTDVLPIEGLDPAEAAQAHKWTDGVLARDGAIYCIPHNARRVLRVDARLGRAVVVGPDLGPKPSKWMGAVLGPDGCIYGVPQDAHKVLRIQLTSGKDACQVDTFGDVGSETFKWRTGVRIGNKVVFLPFSSDHLLWFEPTSAREA